MPRIRLLFFWFLLIVWLGACTTPTPQVTPDILPTRQKTAVLPTIPTATTFSIPATATMIPSVTPSSTPMSTSTPTITPTATAVPFGTASIIGYSAGNHAIESYQFGNGPTTIILIGGMHGGYEWNSILLAYQFIDYLLANPDSLPATLTLFIIPSANPDGQVKVTGITGRFTTTDIAYDTIPGRFNDHGVDLNRNWDCQWQPTGTWRDQTVSGGSYPFSEPESRVLRDFIVAQDPVATIFYHSAFNAIFTGGCPTIGPRTRELAEIYAGAANYTIYEQFDSYPITGDAGDWLTTQNIPSITVELSSHESLDWTRNLNGFLAVLAHFGNIP